MWCGSPLDHAPRLPHQTQRPPAKTNGEVSKVTGQSMSPGPGTYALQGAFGPQYLAVWKTRPVWLASMMLLLPGGPRLRAARRAPGGERSLAVTGASREAAGLRRRNYVLDTGTSVGVATCRTTRSASRSSTRRHIGTRPTPGPCTTCRSRPRAAATSYAPPTRSALAPKGASPCGANASPDPATTPFRMRLGHSCRPSTSPVRL